MAEELKIQNLTTEKTEFKREVGVFGGVSLLGGIMIGSGIFYIGSYVMMRTGMSQGLSLLAWIIGGIVCLLGGLCLAELGTAMPKAGGMTVYLNEAYHPIVGFLCGFSSWLLGGPGSIAGIAIALPTAMRTFFDLSDFSIKMIAVILILGLTVYNYLGIKQGSVLQNITMVAKLVPIVIILVAVLFWAGNTGSKPRSTGRLCKFWKSNWNGSIRCDCNIVGLRGMDESEYHQRGSEESTAEFAPFHHHRNRQYYCVIHFIQFCNLSRLFSGRN